MRYCQRLGRDEAFRGLNALLRTIVFYIHLHLKIEIVLITIEVNGGVNAQCLAPLLLVPARELSTLIRLQ